MGQSGNFSSSSIENVVIDTRTGRPARGVWEDGKFRALDAESVEHLKSVPMFTGYFKFNDANAMKGVQAWGQTGGVDKQNFGTFIDSSNIPMQGFIQTWFQDDITPDIPGPNTIHYIGSDSG